MLAWVLQDLGHDDTDLVHRDGKTTFCAGALP